MRFGRARSPVASVLLTAALGMTACGDDGGDVTPIGDKRVTIPTGAGVDACGLLTATQVQARLGTGAQRERTNDTSLDGHAFSQCLWKAGDKQLGVVVIATTARYDTHRKNLRPEPVPGLGDAAISSPGTSLETTGGSGGRTVTVKDGERTLVVALDVEPVSPSNVVALARTALSRLR